MSSDPFQQLEEKLRRELDDGHPYEAQQYVQSFLARKKKSLGQSKTSSLVFHGLKLLLDSKAPLDAGSLLVWYIEDGAGVDYQFHLEDSVDLSGEKYCDAQRLLALSSSYQPELIGPFIEKIYGPLHIFESKATNIAKGGPVHARFQDLENLFANVFEATKKWSIAYKSILRLNDIPRAAKVLDLWSKEVGYQSEQPLFYARAIFQLLADKKVDQAGDLAKISSTYIRDDYNEGDPVPGAVSIWHCSIILSELAALPPLPRVDKAKLFTLLMQLYIPLISRIDNKLIEILEKVGPNSFNYAQAPEKQTPNAMALFQNMLAGAAAPSKAAEPAFDLNSMMAMLNQLPK